MFLQDLLKKINENKKKLPNIFSKENLNYLLMNNFKDILVIIASLGILVIIFTILIVYCRNTNSQKISENEINNGKYEEKKSVYDELLLTPDQFIILDSKSFDLTTDYIDFILTKKKFELPDKVIVKNEYDKLLEYEINESIKFNFEKRKNRK